MVEKALLIALVAVAICVGASSVARALESTFCTASAALSPETVVCVLEEEREGR